MKNHKAIIFHALFVFGSSILLVSFCPIKIDIIGNKTPEYPKNKTKAKHNKLWIVKRNLPLVDSAFQAWYNNKHLNGAVLIAMNGEIIYEDYLGYSNPVLKTKIQPNSSFQIASVSKVFTSVAILILKDRGLIRLDDSVQVYLPNFPYHNITIRHLLSHQSGLPNYVYTLLPKLKELSTPNNSDWYKLFLQANLKPLFAAGNKFHYCNTNYALLAFIVEKISGMPFNEFLKKEIFQPLNMKNTFTFRESHTKNNLCRAFTKKGKPENTDANDFILGDKGIYSTPSDLLRFSLALHGGKILSEESYKEATQPWAHENETKSYGLGFRLKYASDSIKKDIYHNGWWHGYRSSFHYFPYDDIHIIMLSNQLDKHVYFTNTIKDLLLGPLSESAYTSSQEDEM